MDVNDPKYGRWVNGSFGQTLVIDGRPLRFPQSWQREFDLEWQRFMVAENEFAPYTIAQIEAELNRIRQLFPSQGKPWHRGSSSLHTVTARRPARHPDGGTHSG